MKIPYFCCIGAELKRYAKDFDFMNQVYLYKVPTDDSMEEVLAEDYFKAISDSVLQDDIVYIYEASAETLHSCRFNKQNGHITAIPLASDETLTGAVTTIIHDNLTKNRAVISNDDGKIAVSDVTKTELEYLSGATSNIQEQLNGKAKTDLSNLTSTGANIGNWSTNVTNCITEIPQDIKLELSSGTLTLKAGSKAYKPDGTTYSATTDTNLDNAGVGGTNTWVIAMTSDNRIFPRALANCVSGADATTTAGYAYDTTTNKIHWFNANGVEQADDCSFPIAIVHTTSGVIDEITQVFNGIGYIGSTLFALPGLKCLGADGRNADGTLKSYATTVSAVTTTTPSTSNGTIEIVIKANSMQAPGGHVRTVKNMNGITSGSAAWYYSIDDNICGVYTPSTQTWSQTGNCLIGTVTMSSGKVASLNTKQVFHAVDYSDTEYIAHQAMPSDRYVDLTLGNDNDPLTAPADGYYMLNKTSGAAGERVGFLGRVATSVYSNAASETLIAYIPVSKGETVRVRFTATGATNGFRFIYANGSK